MFGNTKGWGISALIVVVVGLLIYFMGKPPQITPPTKSIPLAMTAISDALKNADPSSLGIKPAGTDTDAHDFYIKVIEDYQANHFRYEKYSSDIAKLYADKPEFLEWMVDAADCSRGSMFAKKPDTIINYDNEPDSIVALNQVGNLVDTLGRYLVRKNKPEDADPYLKAGFILGQRLYNECLRFREFTAGTQSMTGAASAMQMEAETLHDSGRIEQLKAFQSTISDYQNKLIPVWQAISGIGGNPLSNSGDIFDIAMHGKEPMWRVEATLKLGRMHYMDNVTAADQHGAVRVLKELANDPDSPIVRIAAAKGRDLKVEEFRKIGGRELMRSRMIGWRGDTVTG